MSGAAMVLVRQEDDHAEMMKLLQLADNATTDKRLNSDLRAKIYEQTRLIAELRHDEVNRQQTSRARRLAGCTSVQYLHPRANV